eukprot:m51a1_g9819 hypothetical protein (557) ;mRNA; r:1890359-1892497
MPRAVRGAAAIAAILCAQCAAQALQYVFVEGFPPGGETENHFSVLRPYLEERLGKLAIDSTNTTQQARVLQRLADISQGRDVDQVAFSHVRMPELMLNADSLSLMGDVSVLYVHSLTHNVIMTSKSGGITSYNQLMEFALLRNPSDPLVVGGMGKAHKAFLDSIASFDRRATKLRYVDLETAANCVNALNSGKITAIIGGSSSALLYAKVPLCLCDLGIEVVGGTYFGIVVPKWIEEGRKAGLSAIFDDITKNVSFIDIVRKMGFHPLFYEYPASVSFTNKMAAVPGGSSSSSEAETVHHKSRVAVATLSFIFPVVFIAGALVMNVVLYLRHKRDKNLVGKIEQNHPGAQKYSTLDTPITEAMKTIHSIREHVNPAHAKALKRVMKKLVSTSLTQLDGRSVTNNPEVLDVITEFGVVKEPYLKARGIVPRFSVSSRRAKEATPWIVDNYEVCMMVSRQLEEWDYSPIEFREKVEGHTLSAALLYSFKKFDLIGYLGINDITLCTWAKVVEDSYTDVAFHNKHHAADVVQAVMYLIERSPLARSRELVFITRAVISY